jgi:hypothetical protein
MGWRIVLLVLVAVVSSARLDAAEAENISKSAYPSEDVCVAFNAAGEIGAVWVEKVSASSQPVYFSIRRYG